MVRNPRVGDPVELVMFGMLMLRNKVKPQKAMSEAGDTTECKKGLVEVSTH